MFVPSTALSRGDNHLGAPTVFTDSGVCYLLSDRCRYQVVTTSFLQSSFIRCDNVTQLNAWRLPCLYTRPSNFLPQGGCLSGHLEWQGSVPKKKTVSFIKRNDTTRCILDTYVGELKIFYWVKESCTPCFIFLTYSHKLSLVWRLKKKYVILLYLPGVCWSTVCIWYSLQ